MARDNVRTALDPSRPAWPVVPAMRWAMWAATIFVTVAGVQLFVLSERTAEFFAWTVLPPLEAASLGACYWASALVVGPSCREREWPRARAIMPAALVFSVLTLAASLLHLDRFHLDSVFAWVWLGVYALYPIALAIAFILQARVPSSAPPSSGTVPGWLRGCLVVQAAVLLVVGLALFAAPGAAAVIWPWPLTPLTARATGAWLVLWGIVALQASRERAGDRVRWAMLGLAGLAVLQALALIRFPGDLAATDWRLWGFLAAVLSLAGAGLVGWLLIRPEGSRAAAVSPPATTRRG